MLDLVYIVKEDEINQELRYSLRSMNKYYPENKIWIVGYKPSWVQNVNYLPIKQSKDKWKNSINNILAACNCKDISDDFVLMNDDFFMIKPIAPLELVSNSHLGLLENTIKKYERLHSSWYDAFKQVYELLEKIDIEKPYYDFEAHLPLQINKQKFLEVINLPEVQEFMQSPNVLHKRTLYKNYDKSKKLFKLPHDVKISKEDDSFSRVKICGWLSVADSQIRDSHYPHFNDLLRTNFNIPCKYEVGGKDLANKNIQIDIDSIVIPEKYIPTNVYQKKKDFVHF